MATILHALTPATSSFKILAEGGKFVDKTPALMEFLESEQPVHLVLRPRRSGKTTLLRLFQCDT
jgi:predicted AAA+ superfamily ATPase